MKQLIDAYSSLDRVKNARGALERVDPGILVGEKNTALLSAANDLYYFDGATRKARPLTNSPEEEELSELSPNGAYAGFVKKNDLYVIDCQTGEERRLTKDGSPELLNGKLDWVYQEEVYGRDKFRAFWFSPDSQRIAFLQLDESPVPHYEVSDSISYRQTLEDTRYPKAGEPLPIARVWIVDIASGQLREVDLSQHPAEDRLVVRFTWSPTNELWLQIQNRIQTEQTVLKVDPATGKTTRMLFEKSRGWIEVLGQPKFLPDGDFLWLSDLPDGRRHVHRFDVESRQLKALTRGDWDVADIVGVTADGKTAYVTGTISSPIETHLIRVDTSTGQTDRVTEEAGMHNIRMSEDCQYYLDTWSNAKEPPRTMLKSVDGKVRRAMSAPVSDRYRTLRMANSQLTTIKASDGLDLQTVIMLPPDWSAAQGKLPVLLHVYAGPQAPTVQNGWAGSNFWWHQHLCNQGFAVVLCDNRSSRGRGIADTWSIHRDMGRVELKDIEDAVKWISNQPWGDKDRIGIWGWSYGGYMTGYALTHSQLFKAGISGAPVTDWRNYDAIYTERYMDLPQSNKAGYESSSVVEAAANLHGRLLLIHGERDDNVHMSNSLQLAYALQKAGKTFDLMIYPKNRHGVTDPAQRLHLYRTMTEFLNRHLKN